MLEVTVRGLSETPAERFVVAAAAAIAEHQRFGPPGKETASEPFWKGSGRRFFACLTSQTNRDAEHSAAGQRRRDCRRSPSGFSIGRAALPVGSVVDPATQRLNFVRCQS